MKPGHYYHFGLANGILESLKHEAVLETNILQISLNVDGLPLTKSSKSQFWPILARFETVKESRPFPVGMYQGNTKPENANDFLRPFVNELKEINGHNL